jgi:hypothetical protein
MVLMYGLATEPASFGQYMCEYGPMMRPFLEGMLSYSSASYFIGR